MNPDKDSDILSDDALEQVSGGQGLPDDLIIWDGNPENFTPEQKYDNQNQWDSPPNYGPVIIIPDPHDPYKPPSTYE